MNTRFLTWVTFVAVNGGLLYGLNMAGISGAVDGIKTGFSLTDSGLGTVAALLTVGALIGALFTGNFTEMYGRKNVMVATAVLYIISGSGCALAASSFMLIVFRVLSGLAVGATSVVTPMYISEISPAKNRGTMVSFYQFALTIGILLAYIFDYLFVGMGDSGWRYMLAIPAISGILFLIFLTLKFPESPRWLLSHDKKKEAVEVLIRLGGKQLIKEELPEMEVAIASERKKKKMSVAELFKGKTGKVVLIGTLIAAFQQIIGINAVVMYAPVIFQTAGSAKNDSLMMSMVVGIVNFLMTLFALWLVDKKGRNSNPICLTNSPRLGAGTVRQYLKAVLAFAITFS